MREHKYVIIGGGCSGMAAALQLWKLGEEDILLIDRGERLGGVLNQCLHQGFGDEYFECDMTGREFALQLSEKLGGTGVKVMTDTTAAGTLRLRHEGMKGCTGSSRATRPSSTSIMNARLVIGLVIE